MVNLIWAVIVMLAAVILVGRRRMAGLIKPALIGPVLLFIIEWNGVKAGRYTFPNSLVLIEGVPFFHILSGLWQGFIFLNWLPRKWPHIILYTALMSLLYLAVEAVHIVLGAFVHHPPWDLLRSAVLNLLAFLLYAGIIKFFFHQEVYQEKNHI